MKKPFNRTIKFRAWDLRRKRWTGSADRINNLDEKIALSQYTGYKDGKGQPIYEGDLIKLKDKTGVVLMRSYKDGARTTTNRHYGYIVRYKREEMTLPDACKRKYKIIGNILENKELINK